MKILRLTTLLNFGGQEKQYLSFTEKPELLRHKYIFMAIGFGGYAERVLRERGFDVIVLNQRYSIRNLKNILRIYRIIKKVKPDVVHTAAAEANFQGIIAAKLAGVPYIIGEEIGIPKHSIKARLLFKLIYKCADQIICVSKAVKRYLLQIKEIPTSKGIVLYNPVSFPNIYDKIKKEIFEIVYVGRLEAVKNVRILIQALAKVENGYHLTIVGDGAQRENLEKQIKDMSLHSNIHIVGFTNDPGKYLSQADLFVLPSYSEGFGIAVIEAMFLRVPVLCSRVGGIPEFVEEGRTGWLFDPNNIQELLEKLNVIFKLSEKDRLKIGDNGYYAVIDRFTIEQYVNQIENIYESRNIHFNLINS